MYQELFALGAIFMAFRLIHHTIRSDMYDVLNSVLADGSVDMSLVDPSTVPCDSAHKTYAEYVTKASDEATEEVNNAGYYTATKPKADMRVLYT